MTEVKTDNAGKCGIFESSQSCVNLHNENRDHLLEMHYIIRRGKEQSTNPSYI